MGMHSGLTRSCPGRDYWVAPIGRPPQDARTGLGWCGPSRIGWPLGV